MVSPKMLMEMTVAGSHFNSQLKINCPQIVEISASPKNAPHVELG